MVETLFEMVSHILDVLTQVLDVNRTYRSAYCVPFFPGDIEASRQFAELASQGSPILLHAVEWVFLQEVLDSHSIVQALFRSHFWRLDPNGQLPNAAVAPLNLFRTSFKSFSLAEPL